VAGKSSNTEYIKRVAAQIVSQLPEDRRDALCALNYAREILVNLGKSWEVPSALAEASGSIRLVSADGRRGG
jgi:hypothetical protein